MTSPDHEKVARSWVDRFVNQPRRQTPTEFQLESLNLPVSDQRFNRAMEMAARDMGGRYERRTSTIHLPSDMAREGDRSFPSEIKVLYRKFPCGMKIPLKKLMEDNPAAAGYPCVSFDCIPRIQGDPRRSRIYQSFQGEAATSKALFGKFLGWLKIVSKAVKRYQQRVQQGQPAMFGRLASEAVAEASIERVAQAWASKQASQEG